jgi:hypothetical protein
MGQWLCKRHGKSSHIQVCTHFKMNIDAGKPTNFKLVLEELSKSNSSYIASLICIECASKIGVVNDSTIYFDPQIRMFEQDEEFYGEDMVYEGIFDMLDEELVSCCEKCILDLMPDLYEIVEKNKAEAVQVTKKKKGSD